MVQYTSKNAGEFIAEARKITVLANKKAIPLRLIGALAINLHCPKYNYIHDKWERTYTDTDFVTRAEYGSALIEIYRELGYRDDEMITTLYGSMRMVFDNPETGFHSDIFFDKLDFCHVLHIKDRLEVDDLTLPLAELFLGKMQVVEINEKDIVDTLMIVREHPVGESDDETINAKIISRILASEWGFWKTVTINMEKSIATLEKTDLFDQDDKKIIVDRFKKISSYIDAEPKPLTWKLRSKIGTRIQWYKDVDEL